VLGCRRDRGATPTAHDPVLLVVGMGVPMAMPMGMAVGGASVNKLPYFLVVVADVIAELRLLEARGRHALVPAGVAARGTRVRGVEARLDQGLARLRGYHWLELASGERVHMPGLRCHQQHHLGPGQG